MVVGAMGGILIMNFSKGLLFVLKMLGKCTFKKLFKMHVEQVKVSTLNCLKLNNYEVE